MRAATIIAFLAASVALASDPVGPGKAGTVRYLHSLAILAGGFKHVQSKSNDPAQATLRATSGVNRALAKLASHSKNPWGDADFVAACFNPDIGGFAERPGKVPDVFHTAVGLMTVVELKMPMDEYREPALKFLNEHTTTDEDIRIAAAALEALKAKSPKAEQWIKQISAKSNPDGTLGQGGEIPAKTAGMAMTVLRLGGELPNRDTVVRVLKDGQCTDGGYGVSKDGASDLESCYRVVRALTMLKEKPRDAEALTKFVGSCRNADGGYGLKPGEASSASGTYYAVFVLDWLK